MKCWLEFFLIDFWSHTLTVGAIAHKAVVAPAGSRGLMTGRAEIAGEVAADVIFLAALPAAWVVLVNLLGFRTGQCGTYDLVGVGAEILPGNTGTPATGAGAARREQRLVGPVKRPHIQALICNNTLRNHKTKKHF